MDNFENYDWDAMTSHLRSKFKPMDFDPDTFSSDEKILLRQLASELEREREDQQRASNAEKRRFIITTILASVAAVAAVVSAVFSAPFF